MKYFESLDNPNNKSFVSGVQEDAGRQDRHRRCYAGRLSRPVAVEAHRREGGLVRRRQAGSGVAGVEFEGSPKATFWWSVFGGAQSLLGTDGFSALTISQSQSTLEFFLTGSMAKVLTLLHRDQTSHAAPARAVRPPGQKMTAACLSYPHPSREVA